MEPEWIGCLALDTVESCPGCREIGVVAATQDQRIVVAKGDVLESLDENEYGSFAGWFSVFIAPLVESSWRMQWRRSKRIGMLQRR